MKTKINIIALVLFCTVASADHIINFGLDIPIGKGGCLTISTTTDNRGYYYIPTATIPYTHIPSVYSTSLPYVPVISERVYIPPKYPPHRGYHTYRIRPMNHKHRPYHRKEHHRRDNCRDRR